MTEIVGLEIAVSLRTGDGLSDEMGTDLRIGLTGGLVSTTGVGLNGAVEIDDWIVLGDGVGIVGEAVWAVWAGKVELAPGIEISL